MPSPVRSFSTLGPYSTRIAPKYAASRLDDADRLTLAVPEIRRSSDNGSDRYARRLGFAWSGVLIIAASSWFGSSTNDCVRGPSPGVRPSDPAPWSSPRSQTLTLVD